LIKLFLPFAYYFIKHFIFFVTKNIFSKKKFYIYRLIIKKYFVAYDIENNVLISTKKDM